MTLTQLKDIAIQSVEDARDRYIADLEALDHSALSSSPGGAARTPYDFTFETAIVNRRIATRLRRGDPGPFPEGWVISPPEFATKESSIEEFRASVAAVRDALDAIAVEHFSDVMDLPSGPTTALQLAMFCCTHVNYHDAQLNLIQALHGDAEVHWK